MTHPFTIRLPSALHAKLKAQASEQTRSMSQQVEHIVGRWFAAKPAGPNDACTCVVTHHGTDTLHCPLHGEGAG